MTDPFRDRIRALEALKDKIAAAFRGARHLDRAVAEMWCGDAGEMYYKMVAAGDLPAGQEKTAYEMLEAAVSRFEQVRSEVRVLGETGAALERELEQVFGACLEELRARLPRRDAAPPGVIPRVVMVSPEEYQLPCSVCGEIAVIFKIGTERPGCLGITRAVTFDAAKKDAIFSWLASEDLPALHSYMEGERDIEGGLDAYCPSCDRIFCHEHYRVTERWDEGFYDCSYGECPSGHKRLIDD